MKSLIEQSHYEILEISRGAGLEKIERAYRLARMTYDNDSLATYSVLDADDAQAILERVECAYRVLSDDASRRAYDRFIAGDAPSERPPAADAERAEAAAPETPPAAAVEPQPRAPEPLAPATAPEEDSGEFDGKRLRRARMRCGVDVDQIASITRINPVYLTLLEDERFDQLPASVYVRGFVAAYARCVGLDPELVANSYMARLEGIRSAQRRGWLLGRR